jgi:hypothetical protein
VCLAVAGVIFSHPNIQGELFVQSGVQGDVADGGGTDVDACKRRGAVVIEELAHCFSSSEVH